MSEPLTEAQLLAMLSDVVGARSEASRSYWAAYYRDDVPRLVDEVHRLLAEVRRLQQENDRLCVLAYWHDGEAHPTSQLFSFLAGLSVTGHQRVEEAWDGMVDRGRALVEKGGEDGK